VVRYFIVEKLKEILERELGDDNEVEDEVKRKRKGWEGEQFVGVLDNSILNFSIVRYIIAFSVSH